MFNFLLINYTSGPKWVPGTIVEQTGPISFKVQTDNQGMVKRHQDQLRKASCFDSLVETQGGKVEFNDNFDLEFNDNSDAEFNQNISFDENQRSVHQDQNIDVRSNVQKASDTVETSNAPAEKDFISDYVTSSSIHTEQTLPSSSVTHTKQSPLTSSQLSQPRRSGRTIKPPDKLNL